MSKALVVLSGGQDSVTCLFLAVQKFGAENVSAITFDYGQRHNIELEAAYRAALIAGIGGGHEFVTIGTGALSGTSPLTNLEVPLEQYADFAHMGEVIGSRIEKTFVPMRNALFLTVAANRAAVQGIRTIVTGVCEQDGANYPDCRETFIEAFEEMTNEALGLDLTNMIRIETPLMYQDKGETVSVAFDLPGAMLALSFSHTAYDGQYPPTGKDHATLLRAKGFEDAGLPDPLVLRAVKENLMVLPDTANYGEDWVEQMRLHVATEARALHANEVIPPEGAWWL